MEQILFLTLTQPYSLLLTGKLLAAESSLSLLMISKLLLGMVMDFAISSVVAVTTTTTAITTKNSFGTMQKFEVKVATVMRSEIVAVD